MKRLGILGAVFVALLLVVFVQRWQRGKVVVSAPAMTVKVDAEKVSRVVMRKLDGDVELVKSGSDWKLVQPIDYPANAELVRSMLRAVEEVKLQDVISRNPETRGTYQVDSTGTQVEIFDGNNKVLGLVIGKSTSDWTHTFVRRIDGEEVYRAEGVLSYNFNRRAEDWRDKSILRLEDSTITRVTLEYPQEKQQLVLTRADSVWTLEANGRTPELADSLAVARLVSGVARLSTVSFATPEEIEGKDFAAAEFRVRVQAGSATHAVEFLAVDDNRLLARRQGEDTVFSLFKSNLGNIMKKADELRHKKA